MEASESKPSLRLFGDRSGFGSFCVLSLSHCLGVEVEFAGPLASPPVSCCPEQRPCLCLSSGCVGGVRAICDVLLSLNPKQAAAKFPLLFRDTQGSNSALQAGSKSCGPEGFWGEQQWINFVLFTLQPALQGINKPEILGLLEKLEETFSTSGCPFLCGSASLSAMLLFSVFKFYRWAGSLPDYPRISHALKETEKTFAAAFAAAAAAAPPPAPGPLLLSRRSLSACCSAAAAMETKEIEKQKYYLTTAIAYTNGLPHMGHAYEYLAADVLARFYRFRGCEVKFVTGTDEHGMKIAAAAAKEGVPPAVFVKRFADQFASLLTRLHSTNDFFVRTATDEHKRVCQWLWEKCRAKGDIYLGVYRGWYNQREETFVSERDAKATDYKDPVSGKPLEEMQEESYFFRMGRYQEQLLEYIKGNPGFIAPIEKRNEILKRLEEPLQDLSCSRASFSWGVPVPGDERHVMYVWFDALTNYISALDPLGVGGGEMGRYWPASLHLIGKDIIWFHCVIWPCMLMSAGLPLPTRVFAHGFVLGAEGEKMSKSLGNIVDPEEILGSFPADTFRFFMLKEARYGCDLRFDKAALAASHNNELVNTLGNLLHRLTALTAKFCGGVVPAANHEETPPRQPPFDLSLLSQQVVAAFDETALREGLELPMQAVRDLNKFLTDVAPWACKDDKRRQEDIRLCLECLYTLAHFLEPYLPEAMKTLFKRLNTKPRCLHELSPWFSNLAPGTPVDSTAKVLFEPIPVPEAPAAATAAAAAAAAAVGGSKQKQQQKQGRDQKGGTGEKQQQGTAETAWQCNNANSK